MAAVRASVEMPLLSGLQEAQVHIFVIAINAIQKLLPFAARAAGFKISKDDQRALLQFEPLRDFYEHIEQRLPKGKTRIKRSQRLMMPTVGGSSSRFPPMRRDASSSKET